jgi:hypothetical protein
VHDTDRIASAWIEELKRCREQPGTPVGWGFRELNRLVKDDPDSALSAIEAICRTDASAPVIEVLAAGPLENLLVEHGRAVIERVVDLAKSNVAFRDLLGGVWRSTIEGAVWVQVEAARSGVW